jgi:hypothetical protein
MFSIRAIYRIPSQKSVFFVLSTPENSSDNPTLSSPCTERGKKRFDRILQDKNLEESKKCLKWTATILLESDFLVSLRKPEEIKEELSSPSFHNPVCMELLTINLSKNPQHPSETSFNTPKTLNMLPSEDIIEIFI